MDSWNTLEQDIQRFFKRSQQPFTIDEFWDMYEEGLFLQQSLDELLPNSDREKIAVIVDPLVKGQHHLQNYLLQYASTSENKKTVREWLVKRVSELEGRSRHVMGDIVHSRITVAAELQSVAHELFFLKRLGRRIYEGGENVLPDILNEVHHLVMQSDDGNPLFQDEIVKEELLKLCTQALSVEVDKFAEKVCDNLKSYQEQQSTLNILWGSLRWGGEIQPQISRTYSGHETILEKCRGQRDLIKKQLQDEITKLEEKERWAFIEQILIDAQDMIDDILVSVEEKSLHIATKSLEIVREDIEWLSETVEPYLTKEMPESLKKQCKKYHSRNKFFHSEIQDKKIQYRMERIFGRKFVRFFDRFIILLIIGVIVLLVVEEFGNFSPQAHNTFMYIDTGICVIFLFEFFTKLFLAEGKWLYFRRRWFTELLPSIPFGLLSQLPQLNKVQFLRGVRLVRILRMVRIFRVVTFLIRGTDRFVRAYGRWLNRNIVFFGKSHNKVKQKAKPTVPERLHTLRNICLNRSRSIFNKVHEVNKRIPFMIAYIKTLEIQMEENISGTLEKEQIGASSDILVEKVIQNMLYITGEQVEESMGYEFPLKVHMYFRFFNIPLFRSMPIVRSIVQKNRESDAMEFTAWLGRCIGRLVQAMLAAIYWFVDLYGVLSPPRVLDRLGNAMVETFKRPAIRLVVAGGVILILKLMFIAWPWMPLGGLVNFLNTVLGTPLLIIGGLCCLPLIVGIWLRNIAGEATEFFMRTAEAQFINLLEDIKLKNSERDMRILYERVMKPELQILTSNSEAGPYGEKWLLDQWNSSLEVGACVENDNCNVTTVKQARLWNRQRPVFLLYRDYLDGAPLHRSDVKTTEQLLGNIAIENIRKHRLEYKRKESKALDKLDLESSKSILGPYLWFSFITHSVSHNVASLLVEYNKNAIPESLLAMQTSKKLDYYSKWLKWRLQEEWDGSKSDIHAIQKDVAKKETERIELDKKKKRKKIEQNPVYATTRFNALHFLTLSREQDQSIRLTFGEDLYKSFTKDRKENIRYIFGTYPLYLLPATQRKVNPYNLYQNYLAGGKVFALPFLLLFSLFGLVGTLIKWSYQKVREIVYPDMQTEPPKIIADFNVAIRKINRMRKPVYIECMKLRARFDFEYLGLEFEGFPGLSTHEENFRDDFLQKDENPNWLGLFEKDLEFISALDSEYDYFYDLYTRRKERLQSFNKFLKQREWDEGRFSKYIESIDPHWASRSNEILRALATAYSINYKKLPSLLNAREVLETAFDNAIEHLGYVQNDRVVKKGFRLLYRTIKTCGNTIKDRDYKDFNIFWSQSRFADSPAKHKKWCWKTYLARRVDLKDALYFLTESGDVSIAEDIIQDIIRNPTPWTEELLAIRTVQTLSVLDVLNYRGHVAILGDYPEKNIYMDREDIKDKTEGTTVV
ncbi:ion transporter [Candidatus Uabimicrobium sp. HlEnr_7]|uniref:ion transporter n=1 Tax=Candidatus Uabimicrobium helgolandensis TaxID=3095367 RepID=UPI00355861C7